ncbi:jg19809 [Pararge aegeria aegeria]|uniref:Jg19809 protein n=1 Tax=Pararge aegeria aegeria TaxID=348720 RepID=A0A8S4SI28_9NEOP|nr:jg19809 [Pararge aegeria aegeria]
MEARRRGDEPMPREYTQRRFELRQILMAEWKGRLENPSAGHATIAAIRPVMEDWLGRHHGALSFRLTQILTGHGCFGKYLCRIGREQSPGCHHCDDCLEDTAQHTLEVCPAWAGQRRALENTAAGDLSLPTIVQTILRSESAWNTAASFCEEVMSAKEAAERDRERTSTLPTLAGDEPGAGEQPMTSGLHEL